jgi:hypothetical protein
MAGDGPAGEREKAQVALTEELEKFRAEMVYFRTSLIRWMFIFSIGHVVVMICILFAFLRK